MEVIKVRRPKPIRFFGIEGLYQRYSNRQYKYMQSLPNNGDYVKIIWLPNNRGVKNAYIGFEGVVESMNKIEGAFAIKSQTAILICNGNFDYIKL